MASSATASIGDDVDRSAAGFSSPTTTTCTTGIEMFRPYADAQRPHRSKRAGPDPSLAAGMPLPLTLRRTFPKELIGKPIDEFDPFYANKTTFVVVGHHWTIFRFDGEKSLFMMSPASRVRNGAITTVTHAAFHYFMFLVILSNTICFMHYEYYVFHEFFFLVYFIELLIKVIAYGFLAKRFTYLRDPWNWIDFLATMTGFIAFYIVTGSMAPLRFLRLVNFFMQSRLSFATASGLLLKIRDVICYAAFSLFFYAVFFMNSYAGVLSQRCVREFPDDSPSTFSRDNINISNWYTHDDKLQMLCGNTAGAIHCPDNYTCIAVPGVSANYGNTNFDTFFYSAMSVLRIMTRDWWEGLLTQVESAMGASTVVPFVVVLVFGSFLLNNFILAHMALAHGQLMSILDGKKSSKSKDDENKETDQVHGVVSTNRDNEFSDRENVENDNLQQSVNEAAAHYNKSESPKQEPELVIVMNKDEKKNDDVDMEANPLSLCCSSCCELLCSWKCCSRMQTCLSSFVLSRYFDWFICSVIISNVVCMLFEHHNMSWQLTRAIYYVNVSVLFIFVVEAIMKILAMSPNRYFRDSWCTFEFLIVLFATVELGLEGIQGLTILRAFRLFRVVRLAKFYDHFNKLLELTYLNTFMLAVFVLAFGLFGLNTFGIQYLLHRSWVMNELPRLNFADFWHSLLIVFRILCGQWSEAFWDCTHVSGSACLPYFFVVVVLGNLLVLNVFISMIMKSMHSNHLFDTGVDDDEAFDLSSFADCFKRLCFWRQKQGILRSEKIPAAKSEEQLFEISLEGEPTTSRNPQLNITEDGGGAVAELCCPPFCYSCGSPATCTPSSKPQKTFWKKWQTVRNWALAFSNHRYFHTSASVFIFVTSVMQVLEDQRLSSNEQVAMVSRVTSIVVCVFFSLELALKFLGVGFHKYFSEEWNYFDFTVTALHILSYLVTGFGSHRSLELLKALRILKLFSYHKCLRVVIEAVFFRFGHVLRATLSSFLLWLIFAMLGVQMFGGYLYRCVDYQSDAVLPVEIVNNRSDCLKRNYTWINSDINFDHFPNALFALLQVATMRGDLSILYNVMDIRSYEGQPSRDSNVALASYFMLFMAFGVLCCFACLFRAFITKVNIQKRIDGGYLETLLTPAQKFKYIELKKTFFKRPLKTMPEPNAACLLPLYRIVTSRTFNLVVFLVLVFNAAAMALHYPFIGSRMYNALEYVQLAFNSFFLIEIVLKLIAFRGHFFGNSWNVYDFIVIVPLPIRVMTLELMPQVFSPLLLRLLILLRLVRRIKCVRRVANTIYVSLSAYSNVASVLFVIVFFGARLGVGWFGDGTISYEAGIDELHNFDDFGSAASTMTQMSLGGLWDGIHRGLDAGSENSFLPTVFVLGHLLVCFLIIVQFAVVLLLEHYERLWKKTRLGITDQDLEDFSATWRVFDPYGSGTMSYENFADFLAALPPTYKVEIPIDEGKIASLGITATLQEQRLTYDDVLIALLRTLDVDKVVFVESTAFDGSGLNKQ